jgi:hypothetical protein
LENDKWGKSSRPPLASIRVAAGPIDHVPDLDSPRRGSAWFHGDIYQEQEHHERGQKQFVHSSAPPQKAIILYHEIAFWSRSFTAAQQKSDQNAG